MKTRTFVMRASKLLFFLAPVSSIMHAQPANIDFDSPNDLSGNFAVGGSYQQVTSGGITGGAVTSVKGTGGFATYEISYSQPVSASVSFFYDNSPLQELPLARIGWGGDPAAVDFVSANSYFWVEFMAGGLFRYTNRHTGDETGGLAQTSPTPNHWLNIEVSLTPLPNGSQFMLSGSLTDLGSTGTDAPVFLGGGSTTVQTDSQFDFSLFAGFFGDAPRFDNFQIIPEPSAASLAMISALALIFLRKTPTSSSLKTPFTQKSTAPCLSEK